MDCTNHGIWDNCYLSASAFFSLPCFIYLKIRGLKDFEAFIFDIWCLSSSRNSMEIATYFGIFRAFTRTCVGIVELYGYILTNQTLLWGKLGDQVVF